MTEFLILSLLELFLQALFLFLHAGTMQILPFFFFLFSFLGLVRKYFWMDFSCPTLGARLEANSMTTLKQRKNVFPFLINWWIYIPLFKRKNDAFTLTVLVIKVIISLAIYKLLYIVYASYRSTDLILADAELCFWDRWEVECWGEEWGPPLSTELQLRRCGKLQESCL